jgi:hypothetical protein
MSNDSCRLDDAPNDFNLDATITQPDSRHWVTRQLGMAVLRGTAGVPISVFEQLVDTFSKRRCFNGRVGGLQFPYGLFWRGHGLDGFRYRDVGKRYFEKDASFNGRTLHQLRARWLWDERENYHASKPEGSP